MTVKAKQRGRKPSAEAPHVPDEQTRMSLSVETTPDELVIP